MILVTGGTGFIGANLVDALLRDGRHAVAVCDRLDHPEKAANIDRTKLAALVEPDAIGGFLKDHGQALRAVFHLGAISATTETDWNRLQHSNVDATLALWDWCTEQRVPLVYASSAATYGDGSEGFDDAFSSAALARLKPLNLYARSKHIVDREICARIEAGRPSPPQWVGLKFFNVYGPRERHKGEQRSIMCKIYDQIRADGRARLFRSHNPDYEDGGQLRDFVWIGDCVDVMLWLLDAPQVSGLFNLGTGKARSFLDVARAVFAAMELPAAIDFIEMPLSLRDKYQYYTCAPMTRLRAAGYTPAFTELEEGVRRYVQDWLMRQTAPAGAGRARN